MSKPAGGEEPHVELVRRLIEEQYQDRPTGCGGSFGEILCHEIHTRGLTFEWLARKWGVSLSLLGELIADHCRRLERLPRVDHEYRADQHLPRDWRSAQPKTSPAERRGT